MNWLKKYPGDPTWSETLHYWMLDFFFRKTIQRLYTAAVEAGSKDAFRKALKDLEDTNAYNTDEKAKQLMEKRLTALLSPVDLSMIVSYDSRTRNVYIGGEPADPGRLGNLRAEAEFFEQSELWKLMKETPKRLAERAMFTDDGKIDTQLLKGRAMLFLLDTQQKLLDTFKSYTQPPSPPKDPPVV